MRYPHLAGRLFNVPLMVRPSYARTVATVMSDRMGPYEVEGGDKIDIHEKDARKPSLDKDGVLTVPIVGGLYHRGNDFDAMSGVQSYSGLQNELVAAMDDPAVKAILFDIDSPGGEAGGCFSFAETVKTMRQKKPIWAVANSGAASAAYAIGSACTKFYAASDAMVGSIGVVWLHMDHSGMLAKEGLVASYVYAGKHKTDGNPFEPLEGDAKAEIQRLIDDRYQQFVSLVASNRSMSAEAIKKTEAKEYLASEAAELGLIDGVKSYAEVRQMLANGEGRSKLTFVKGYPVMVPEKTDDKAREMPSPPMGQSRDFKALASVIASGTPEQVKAATEAMFGSNEAQSRQQRVDELRTIAAEAKPKTAQRGPETPPEGSEARLAELREAGRSARR